MTNEDRNLCLELNNKKIGHKICIHRKIARIKPFDMAKQHIFIGVNAKENDTIQTLRSNVKEMNKGILEMAEQK
ncbi:hypothetical protein [Sphingobacterium siyangense]|uniref:hypothetical protein n=1 Tax=Sphingobacterium siyangense TaxID=459529 RepID=UPI003C743CDF